MSKKLDFGKLAEGVATAALKDLGDLGTDVSVQAQRALALQLSAAAQKLLGIDTTLIEKSVETAYYNLAVASSAATARKVRSVFGEIAKGAVGALWEAAGLPEAPLADPEE